MHLRGKNTLISNRYHTFKYLINIILVNVFLKKIKIYNYKSKKLYENIFIVFDKI